jgi:FXSXX-COOH protein
MDSTSDDGFGALGRDAGFPDVTEIPLRELFDADDTVLGHAMRQLLAEMEAPQEIIAAFGSYPHDV